MGHTWDTNKNNKNIIYFNLLNKYKAKISNVKFGERIKILNQLKSEKDYNELLTPKEQDELFNELISS